MSFPCDGYVFGVFGRPFCQVNFVDSEPEFCFFLQEKVAFTIWDRFFSNANVHDNGSDYKADAVQITCARLGIVIGLRIFDLEIVRTCFQDMRAIPELADQIARRYYEIPKDQRNGKCQITTSTSFFIPKPFTPFQWARMYTNEEYISRAAIVKHAFNEQLNRKSLKYHWHDAEVTVLEGVFARGDRKTSEVIKEAYRLGCLYDSWSDQFDNDKWMQAFENTGIDIAFYNLRERPLDEVFPWDFIDIGVTKEFLKQEWNHAMNAEVTPNCRMKCSGCGVAKWKGGVCIESKN